MAQATSDRPREEGCYFRRQTFRTAYAHLQVSTAGRVEAQLILAFLFFFFFFFF